MMCLDYLTEFGTIIKEVIDRSIIDYIKYKQAQGILNSYQRKDNFCTACGVLNEKELESLTVIGEYEEIQRNREEMKIRLRRNRIDRIIHLRNFKKIKKTA